MSLPTSTHPFLITGNDANQYKIANSLRFRASNSAYLSRTPTSAGSRTTWTFSCWIKRGLIGSGSTNYAIFGSSGAGTTECSIYFLSDDTIRFVQRNGASVDWNLNTPRVFRDPSAWYHLVFVLNTTSATASSRASIYINGQLDNTSASYPSQNYTSTINNNIAHWIGSVDWGSTRAYYSDCYMAEVNFIDGQALTPSSFGQTDSLTNQWVPKQYTGTYGTNGFYLPFNSPSLSTNLATAAGTSATAPFGGTVANALTSDSVYLTSNTSTGSSFDFIKYDFGAPTQLTRYQIGALYFTGGTSTFQIQYSNDDVSYTAAASLSVTGSGQNFSGNLNVVARYIKIRPTSFGTNGQANIDLFAVYQDGLGLDSSGNGNNWTPNNISVTSGTTYDVMRDSPTGYDDGSNIYNRGNYCTLNPLISTQSSLLTNGNLTWTNSSGSANQGYATLTYLPNGFTYYYEAVLTTIGSGGSSVYTYVGDGNTFYATNGQIYSSGSLQTTVATYTTGDIIGFAGTVGGSTTYYKNGSSVFTGGVCGGGIIVNGFSGTVWNFNFGQRPFSYTPPAGFKALNSFNLPNPSLPLV